MLRSVQPADPGARSDHPCGRGQSHRSLGSTRSKARYRCCRPWPTSSLIVAQRVSALPPPPHAKGPLRAQLSVAAVHGGTCGGQVPSLLEITVNRRYAPEEDFTAGAPGNRIGRAQWHWHPTAACRSTCRADRSPDPDWRSLAVRTGRAGNRRSATGFGYEPGGFPALGCCKLLRLRLRAAQWHAGSAARRSGTAQPLGPFAG
jgi:hypothetical protein